MSSSKGKKVVLSWGGGTPRCAACQYLRRACGMEMDCVFAPHFPAGDDPGRFAAVHKAFGADNVRQFLGSLPPDYRADVARWLVLNAPGRLAVVQHHHHQQQQQQPSAGALEGGSPCEACRRLQIACVPGCVFEPHFPPGDDPARFAAVDVRFGADNVALILCSLSPDQQVAAVRSFLCEEQQTGAASPPPLQVRRRCAACMHLHRVCEPDCVFRPYFPPDDDPGRFAAAHRVHGARNLATQLLAIPLELRGDSAASSVYEARRRRQDPVFGVMGDIVVLDTAVKLAIELLASTRKELERYVGEEAASTSLVPAHELQEVATMQEVEDGMRAATDQVIRHSAADAIAGVTDSVTPLHEKLVKDLTPDVPESSTGVTVAFPGPAQSAADILMQQSPSHAPPAAAAAGVRDPGLPEGKEAGDEPSQGSP